MAVPHALQYFTLRFVSCISGSALALFLTFAGLFCSHSLLSLYIAIRMNMPPAQMKSMNCCALSLLLRMKKENPITNTPTIMYISQWSFILLSLFLAYKYL